MSRDRLPPPEPEACRVRLRPSTQKGGTIIAEDVVDRETHERRICDPDAYRPSCCPRCGARTLPVHDYRERVRRADPDAPIATVVRHLCVACRAIWQVLPAFIARHLWRTWRVVTHVLTADARVVQEPARRWPPVPRRTVRRWRARWQRSGRPVRHILAASGAAAWAAIVAHLGPDAPCADLIRAYAATGGVPPVAAFAALLYRLQPKVRLM